MIRNPRMFGRNPINESRPCWMLSLTSTAASGMCCSSWMAAGAAGMDARRCGSEEEDRTLTPAALTTVLARNRVAHVNCGASVQVFREPDRAAGHVVVDAHRRAEPPCGRQRRAAAHVGAPLRAADPAPDRGEPA